MFAYNNLYLTKNKFFILYAHNFFKIMRYKIIFYLFIINLINKVNKINHL